MRPNQHHHRHQDLPDQMKEWRDDRDRKQAWSYAGGNVKSSGCGKTIVNLIVLRAIVYIIAQCQR